MCRGLSSVWRKILYIRCYNIFLKLDYHLQVNNWRLDYAYIRGYV